MRETDAGGAVRASLTTPLGPEAAFDVFVHDLAAALAGAGLTFEPGAKGRVVEDGREVGRVTAWVPGGADRARVAPGRLGAGGRGRN